MKKILAEAIAARLENNQVIGVGTGTTVDLALEGLCSKINKQSLNISVVCSSYASSWTCAKAGLRVLDTTYSGRIDWGFDGADEVDPNLRLIKGKGAALLPEKILASKCSYWIIIVDETKLVTKLGEKQPVPIEIIPSARFLVEKALHGYQAKQIELRSGSGKHGPVITEAGNIILDVKFENIPIDFEQTLKAITGVVETGIFTKQASEVLVATQAGVKSIKRTQP